MAQGSCLCGAVTFEADEPLRPVVFCHCGQCRHVSGHFWAATSVPHEGFRLIAEAGLEWFRSSASARRGFCRECGASLFWQPEGEARIAIAAGAFDGASGLQAGAHIFTGDAGDYYAPEGPPPPAAGGVERLECGCLCGKVGFSLPGPAGRVTACHCQQCRKLSGHYAASFDTDEAVVIWRARDTLAEYPTSGGGRRGFCRACGSSLYFRAADRAFSVEAGAVIGASGGHLDVHVFTAERGDYYAIDDGLPQRDGA